MDTSGDALSPRELEILGLMGTGASNRVIGERLCLSPHTIKEYATAIYRKLGVGGRVEAVREATQRGMLD